MTHPKPPRRDRRRLAFCVLALLVAGASAQLAVLAAWAAAVLIKLVVDGMGAELPKLTALVVSVAIHGSGAISLILWLLVAAEARLLAQQRRQELAARRLLTLQSLALNWLLVVSLTIARLLGPIDGKVG